MEGQEDGLGFGVRQVTVQTLAPLCVWVKPVTSLSGFSPTMNALLT